MSVLVMAWNIRNLMKSRTEFAKMAQLIKSGEAQGSFGELCQRYGISRKNGYKWLNRYEAQGVEGLEDQTRRPHHQPARSKDKTEQAVLDLRAVRLNGHWDRYWQFHRQQQHQRLYGCSAPMPQGADVQALELAA